MHNILNMVEMYFFVIFLKNISQVFYSYQNYHFFISKLAFKIIINSDLKRNIYAEIVLERK